MMMNSRDKVMLDSLKRDVVNIINGDGISVDTTYRTNGNSRRMLLDIEITFTVPEENFSLVNKYLSSIHDDIDDLCNNCEAYHHGEQ